MHALATDRPLMNEGGCFRERGADVGATSSAFKAGNGLRLDELARDAASLAIAQGREALRRRDLWMGRGERWIRVIDAIDILDEPAMGRCQQAREKHRSEIGAATPEEMGAAIRADAEEARNDEHGVILEEGSQGWLVGGQGVGIERISRNGQTDLSGIDDATWDAASVQGEREECGALALAGREELGERVGVG